MAYLWGPGWQTLPFFQGNPLHLSRGLHQQSFGPPQLHTNGRAWEDRWCHGKHIECFLHWPVCTSYPTNGFSYIRFCSCPRDQKHTSLIIDWKVCVQSFILDFAEIQWLVSLVVLYSSNSSRIVPFSSFVSSSYSEMNVCEACGRYPLLHEGEASG